MEIQNSNQHNENEEDETKMQEARAFLRERFLRFVAKLPNGQDCDVAMHENTNVKVKIRAVDSNFENIVVENLQTPYLPVDKAILRTSDIISIHIKDIPGDLIN